MAASEPMNHEFLPQISGVKWENRQSVRCSEKMNFGLMLLPEMEIST